MVRALPCHGRGYGFEPRRSRHSSFAALAENENWHADMSRHSETTADDTGNRRFLPLKVLLTDPAHGVDLNQLWAEVWQLYLNGAEWWPSDALLAMLVVRHKEHSAINNIEDAVSVVYDLEHKPVWGNVSTCTEILTSAGRSQPTKNDVNILAAFLRKSGFVYKAQHGKRGFLIDKLLN